MNEKERERIARKKELVETLVHMGYTPEFGVVIADELGTEKMMSRMIGYLKNAKPRSEEEIADEMLSIRSDTDRWVDKKKAEYYNTKYNELLWYGLGTDEDDSKTE